MYTLMENYFGQPLMEMIFNESKEYHQMEITFLIYQMTKFIVALHLQFNFNVKQMNIHGMNPVPSQI
jgi:hypothetical protein